MKTPTLTSSAAYAAVCFAIAASCLPVQAGPFALEWKESGMSDFKLGYRPHVLGFDEEAEQAVTKKPEGLKGAKFAVLQVGTADKRTKLPVIVEWENGAPASLRVDSNANGDLTDDAVAKWEAKEFKKPDDSVSTTWYSHGMIPLSGLGEGRRGQITFYCTEARTREGAPVKVVSWYTDYGLAGKVELGGRSVQAVLQDSGGEGVFRLDAGLMGSPTLWLDLNGDGKPGRGEVTPGTRPIADGDKWWKMAALTPDGKFDLVPTDKPVEPEQPKGPDLSPGQKAPAFTATLTDGKTVKFPDDYKGRVVLLDFWATWCGPCVAEIPNVLEAYGKFHDKGFEVLGVSLDKEGDGDKLAAFVKKRNMPWAQAFDGKGWQAGPAGLYGIRAIPHMILVDGDTGLVIANKDIRGEALAPAIEKGLAGLKK